MAYVPPHLRQKLTGEKPTQSQFKTSRAHRESRDDLFTLFDLYSHFWPPTHEEHVYSPAQSTLNASAQNPSQLKYVILHLDQNPRWKSDGIIFVKSNLTLLPEFHHQKERAQNALKFTNKPKDDVLAKHQEEKASPTDHTTGQQDSSNADTNVSQ